MRTNVRTLRESHESENYDPYELPDITATREGLTVLRPHEDEVLLDLDSDDARREFFHRICYVRQFCGPVIADVWPSHTEGHYHARLVLPNPVTSTERLAVAAILGSDWRHALIGLFRLMFEGDEHNSCVLFEPNISDVYSDIPF